MYAIRSYYAFRLTVEPVRPIAVRPGNVLRIWAVDRASGARQRLAEFTSYNFV